jgi:hypothetical protein
VSGIATAACTAVAELLNSQVRFIQLISFLAGACSLTYLNCLKIELTKNVGCVLIVLGAISNILCSCAVVKDFSLDMI